MTNLLFAPPALGTVLSLAGLPGGSNKIYDRSPHGNHGTITGATWVRLPSGLWCLSFDGGDDDVNCGAGSSLDIATTGQITVELWNKPASGSTYPTILTRTVGNHGCTMQAGGAFPNVMKFFVADGDWQSSVSTTSLQIGTWYHLVGTYDGLDIRIYVNTACEATTAQGVPTAQNTNCYIGDDPSAGGRHYPGLMALFRVYNRALGALEIQNHFNREKHLFGVW